MKGAELGVEEAEQALSSSERHGSEIAHDCCQVLVSPSSSANDLFFFILAFSKHGSVSCTEV